MVHSLSTLLVAPISPLPVADTRRSRLLAASLLTLMGLGLGVSLVELAFVPDFRGTFTAIVAAIVVLGAAYWGSRTRLYRLSACTACVAPAAACAAAAVVNPADPVWYGFMLIAVVFATMFLSARAATVVAVGVFAGLCMLVAWIPELRSPERAIPILSLHAVLSPLLLVSAHHQRALERENQEELRQRDARIAEAQRLAALGLMARGVVHDFSNLLMVIVEHARRLESAVPEVRRDHVEGIRTASERASAITRQLLTFATRRPSEPRLVDVGELLVQIEPLLARMVSKRIRIALDCDREPALVDADPVQLEQVLMNLVVNARDAMPEGGTVTIETRNVVLDARHAAEYPETLLGPHVMVQVSDTGMGMSAETRARAFEPFFTTKSEEQGTGLGLAIVLDIASRNGGHVTVSSTPGAGATFRVYLPVATSQLPRA